MNFREELKQRVRGMSAEQAVDALFDRGALDGVLARRFLVSVEYERRYMSSDESARSIHEDLGAEYGLTRQQVHNVVSGK